ncbi:MAG: inorganic phosphate transporter [Rikenellaceae bacterium]
MDNIYLFILIILAILAMTDLVVGVSNDAVNFLNSAIGSKVAPKVVIMIIASLGILVGCITSNGMMDIAQNGIFNPSLFSYQNVMFLFLAVMFGDIILLDLFNTFGMPTSTTVSLIFGLLGASVAVALSVLWDTESAGNIADYINTSKALTIISGILMSVVIAFVCGCVIMYFTRMIFTFDYKPTFKKYGALWCGFALTAITYFTVVKGFESSNVEGIRIVIDYIYANFWFSLGIIMVVWTLLMWFIQIAYKVNILKITILSGTFALALAFAGNDLVNFIGVFVAGFDAYHIADGDSLHKMVEMSAQYKAVNGSAIGINNIWVLLGAGLIMVITLFTSKKTDKVSKTEVNLARQGDGDERFDSTQLSRIIVRISMAFNKNIGYITPQRYRKYVERRFAPFNGYDEGSVASFDPIRATVNLTVAAILISFATSFKLPLSTTYVTFMVAMGTSLSDKAWGRESAVYRVTGVLTVITGWFLTAFLAFTVAFLIGLFIMYLETVAIVIMIVICVLLIIQSGIATRKDIKKENEKESVAEVKQGTEEVIQQCAEEICNTLKEIQDVYTQTLKGLFREDRKLLKQMVKESNELYQQAHDRKYAVYTMLHTLNENYVKTGHYYVQVVDYVNEVTKALVHITSPSFEHIDNNHQGFTKDQIRDLRNIETKVNKIFLTTTHILKNNDWDKIDEAMLLRDSIFEDFAEITKNQIHRIKEGETSTRSSMLYLDILGETKAMVLHTRNLLKSQKYFVTNNASEEGTI